MLPMPSKVTATNNSVFTASQWKNLHYQNQLCMSLNANFQKHSPMPLDEDEALLYYEINHAWNWVFTTSDWLLLLRLSAYWFSKIIPWLKFEILFCWTGLFPSRMIECWLTAGVSYISSRKIILQLFANLIFSHFTDQAKCLIGNLETMLHCFSPFPDRPCIPEPCRLKHNSNNFHGHWDTLKNKTAIGTTT